MFTLFRKRTYSIGRRPSAHRHHKISLGLAVMSMLFVLVFSQTIWGAERLLSPGVIERVVEGKTSSISTTTPSPAVPAASVQVRPSSPGNSALTAATGPVPLLTIKDPGRRYGIAAGSRLTGLSESQLNTELNDMVNMGVSWVRFDIDWSNVQPDGPDQQHWNDYDKVVKAARAHNLSVLAILDYTPGWARVDDCWSSQCAPRDPAEFATFASLAVARYSPMGVHAWEVWNEPNSHQFWAPQADATAYTHLLQVTYPAIKAVDSQATVLTGGLAPQPTDGDNIGRREFLQRIYAAGAKGFFDAVADHPYTFPRLPADNTDRAWAEMSTTSGSLRSTMIANGDSGKKIWITEYGAPTGGPGPTATPANSETISGAWHVDEELQANILKEAVRLYKTYDWAGPFFWYANKDAGSSSDSNENFFGLIRADGSFKPARDAYKQLILQ